MCFYDKTKNQEISDLTVILVITSPQDRALHITGVPYIHFSSYTRTESLSVVSSSLPPAEDLPLPNGSPSNSIHNPVIGEADSKWLWPHLCAAVWDSLGQGAARDIISFRVVCLRLWKPFIQPILEGNYKSREFSKLMVKNRPLFQSETALDETITALSTTSKPTRSMF